MTEHLREEVFVEVEHGATFQIIHVNRGDRDLHHGLELFEARSVVCTCHGPLLPLRVFACVWPLFLEQTGDQRDINVSQTLLSLFSQEEKSESGRETPDNHGEENEGVRTGETSASRVLSSPRS
jgi:hypothetical protein